MVRCLNCGAILPRPQVFIRWQLEPDADPPSWEGCEYCHSPDIVKVRQCSVCGAYESLGYEVVDSDEFICKNCLTEVDYGSDF